MRLNFNKHNDLEDFLLGAFPDYSYLVSCRMNLYRMPRIKRSPRLITGVVVHKTNCALQSSIKIPKYRSTWPEEHTLGAHLPWGWETTWNIIKLPLGLSCTWENLSQTHSTLDPSHPQGESHISLAISPKSHPHRQACPWQSSASVRKNAYQWHKSIQIESLYGRYTTELSLSGHA